MDNYAGTPSAPDIRPSAPGAYGCGETAAHPRASFPDGPAPDQAPCDYTNGH